MPVKMHLLLSFVLLAHVCLVQPALLAQPTLFSEGESVDEESQGSPILTTTAISSCDDMITRCYEQYGIPKDFENADVEALDGFYGCIMQPADCSPDEENYRNLLASEVLGTLQKVCPECESVTAQTSESEPIPVMACSAGISACSEIFNNSYTEYDAVASYYECLMSVDSCVGEEESYRHFMMKSLVDHMQILCAACDSPTVAPSSEPEPKPEPEQDPMACYEAVLECHTDFNEAYSDYESVATYYKCLDSIDICYGDEDESRRQVMDSLITLMEALCPACDSPTVAPSSEPEPKPEPEQDPMACYEAVLKCHNDFNEAYSDYEPVAAYYRCLDSIDICYGEEDESRRQVMDSLITLMESLCPDCHEETSSETPIPMIDPTPMKTCFDLVTVCRNEFDTSHQLENDMKQMHACLHNIDASRCEAWEESYRQDSIDWVVNKMVSSTSPRSSATTIVTTQKPMTCGDTIEACKRAFQYSPGNKDALRSYESCLWTATKCSQEEERLMHVTLAAIQDALNAYDSDGWANRGRSLEGSLMWTLATLTLSLWLLKG